MKRMLVATAIVLAGATWSHADGEAQAPNIILVLTDDQGWADLSTSTDPEVPEASCELFETPNMYRLAHEGMRFTSGYSSAPICTPTRRSIQFGMTPARQRGSEFISDFHPSGHLSIPQALKRANPLYRCAHFGKWGEVMSGSSYTDENVEANPTALGYDESDGLTGNATGTYYHHIYQAEDYYRNWMCEADDDPKRTFSVTERAVSFMERQVREKHPFFLQTSYYAIHTAYQAAPETIARYADRGEAPRQVMAGVAPMLDDLDTAVGQLLDAVDRLGIADRTYVFLTSDNGGEPGPRSGADVSALPARNHPLRMYKQFLYEGGIRVPFTVRGPGIKANSVCREPVVQYDLLSTFYDLAGGREQLPPDIDGGSLRPLLANEGSGTVQRALPGLVFHRPLLNALSHSALRVGDLKLVVRWDRPWESSRLELYDLGRDIGETSNLAASEPEETAELYGLLVSYLNSVDAEPPCPSTPCGDEIQSYCEECDDGNSSNGDTCLSNCRVAACGDGFVRTGVEACDDGNADFNPGEYCSANCALVPCGVPTNPRGTQPRVGDALFVLRTALGVAACSPRVCDVTGDGTVTTSDALAVLKLCVGIPVALACPV